MQKGRENLIQPIKLLLTDSRANNAEIASNNAQATKSYLQQQNSSFGCTVKTLK